jgi:hypothetical protein
MEGGDGGPAPVAAHGCATATPLPDPSRAESVTAAQIHTGERFGEWIGVIRFKDWAGVEKARSGLDTDANFQKHLAELQTMSQLVGRD